MSVFLVEDEVLIALATINIKKMRIASTGIHIFVFLERMLSCLFVHHVFISFLSIKFQRTNFFS